MTNTSSLPPTKSSHELLQHILGSRPGSSQSKIAIAELILHNQNLRQEVDEILFISSNSVTSSNSDTSQQPNAVSVNIRFMLSFLILSLGIIGIPLISLTLLTQLLAIAALISFILFIAYFVRQIFND